MKKSPLLAQNLLLLRSCLVVLFLFIFLSVISTNTYASSSDLLIKRDTQKICQLTGQFDRELKTNTVNATESQAAIFGTDLGISFNVGNSLFFLFGDTVGTPTSQNPVGSDALAISAATDGDQCPIIQFQKNNQVFSPITIPGISTGNFNVPTGGTEANNQAYVFYATDHSDQHTLGKSILARYDGTQANFTYLYDFSSNKFRHAYPYKSPRNLVINSLPPEIQNPIFVFGSGEYRKSTVSLAVIDESSLSNKSSYKYFSGLSTNNTPVWSTDETTAQPLFPEQCVGEFSVSYSAFLKKWLLLYNCDGQSGSPRGILMRSADSPFGTWSEPQVLFDPWSDHGYCNFMHVSYTSQHCDSVQDAGRDNDWGGEYGPYLIDKFTKESNGVVSLYYTISTWNPYNVMLMKSEITAGLDTCPADLNQDKVINILDYSVLLRDFLKTSLSNPRSDINKDGAVNLLDYSLMLRDFLKTCA